MHAAVACLLSVSGVLLVLDGFNAGIVAGRVADRVNHAARRVELRTPRAAMAAMRDTYRVLEASSIAHGGATMRATRPRKPGNTISAARRSLALASTRPAAPPRDNADSDYRSRLASVTWQRCSPKYCHQRMSPRCDTRHAAKCASHTRRACRPFSTCHAAGSLQRHTRGCRARGGASSRRRCSLTRCHTSGATATVRRRRRRHRTTTRQR